MMFRDGNILDQCIGGNIIVHGCNAQGVMGSGVAKQIREKYPDVFKKYIDDLKSTAYLSKVGIVSWYQAPRGEWIASAITQATYGKSPQRYVSYDAIDTCFRKVIQFAVNNGLSVHVPDMIGAGLGGGNRAVIAAIISSVMDEYSFKDLTVWKYEL
jgi:O-acetyl-ADP-ribose deacetylase (regulator of RNase III)